MDFEEYLRSKKINPRLYKRAMPEQYAPFEGLFAQIHPDSFTAQKLFLINQLRRKFLLEGEEKSTVKKPQARPKITPRIKK